MIITHFENGCFKLQSGETSILINPENNRLKADIVLKTITSTLEDAIVSDLSSGVISFPGEYEINGISITGFPLTGESTDKFLKTVYLLSWEDLNIVLLGHCSDPIPASLMEEFIEADILFLPVGGHFLEPSVAARMVKQIEAKIVIPYFSKEYSEFLKALGQKADSMEKFVFKKKDILSEKGRPILLTEL
jgi:L-ascorbate metabolism protein UlaG (beta-lactamase superfamily)